MIISINQPAFLPWFGYFHRIAISDIHVILDHVQFEKNSYTNRNKIKTSTDTIWVTVPLKTSGRFGHLPINNVEIFNDGKWQKKITESIRQFYAKTPHFSQYFPELQSLINNPYERLIDLLNSTTSYLLRVLEIKTPLIYSSDLNIQGVKSELVLNICKELQAAVYLSGPLGSDYLIEQDFRHNDITIRYHNFSHPVYRQIHGRFLSHLSVIDLIFNEGPNSRNIIKSMYHGSVPG